MAEPGLMHPPRKRETGNRPQVQILFFPPISLAQGIEPEFPKLQTEVRVLYEMPLMPR